jgi:hypothetical protein
LYAGTIAIERSFRGERSELIAGAVMCWAISPAAYPALYASLGSEQGDLRVPYE